MFFNESFSLAATRKSREEQRGKMNKKGSIGGLEEQRSNLLSITILYIYKLLGKDLKPKPNYG